MPITLFYYDVAVPEDINTMLKLFIRLIGGVNFHLMKSFVSYDRKDLLTDINHVGRKNGAAT